MTIQKSSAMSTLLKKAKGTLGTLSDALSSALSSKWGPIIALSALGGLTFHEWQHNSVFRSRITAPYNVAVNLVQATELCHLHGGRLLFATEPQNYLQTESGVGCGFKDPQGVLSLLGEYESLERVVRYRITPEHRFIMN
jgi:hypothetical protein